MSESLLLSRYKLITFLACQRQFELRYLQKLPWPKRPLQEKDEALMARGQQFHQLLQRHFLGWEIESGSIGDAQLRQWYLLFQQSGLQLPNGRILTEMSLTIPIGDHLLNGRFDLLILSENKTGEATAHLFDWKTGKAQDKTILKQDWQTRLYLAMLAEGSSALFDENQPSLKPENINLTYWYVTDPEHPRTIHYSTTQHEENWRDLQAVVAQIESRIEEENWPLTNDLTHCQRCAYQTICQRQNAGRAELSVEENDQQEAEWETAVPHTP